MSDLVGNPEDRFSCVAAQLLYITLASRLSYMFFDSYIIIIVYLYIRN